MERDTQLEEQRVQPGTRWLKRNTSVATRLALSALLISVVSLVVASQVALWDAQGSSEELLQERVSTIGETKADEIEAYFEDIRIEVGELAGSAATLESLRAFRDGYAELQARELDSVSGESSALGEWYLDEFVPLLNALREEPVDPLEFFSGADAAGIYLQSNYIAESPAEIGEKGLLTDARDGSAWTEAHRDLHPDLRNSVERFDLADLYLIEPETNAIVYSTNKEVDFGTSLDTGAHSGSTLARLVREVVANPEPGRVRAVDFEAYTPVFDEPSMFLASPVFDGEQLVGIVAVRVSTAGVDALMSRDWQQGRFGETGEAYLVGPDDLMRSVARVFVEDPESYFEAVEQQDEATPLDRVRAEAFGTTVLLQEIDGGPLDAALAGETGRTESVNYLNKRVYTAYQPVEIPDLEWALLAEQHRNEVDAPVTDLTREAAILTAVFVAGLTFLAVIWANGFVSPLRRISEVIQRIRREELDTPVPSAGAAEFRELAVSFNQMAGDLQVRRDRVSDAVAAKMEVLRRLLPANVVRSVEAGDRSMLEKVPQATVVVLVVHGIDDLAKARSVAENRELLHRAIDEFDALAEINGLERVKLMADTYYAACGLGTPYLDHAPRAAAFALQVNEFLGRLAAEEDVDLAVAAGLQFGPVSVGLTGEARLVYDLWGEPVRDAHQLARIAKPGQVLVSSEVRDRLPEAQQASPVDTAEGGSTTWVLTSEAGTEGAGT